MNGSAAMPDERSGHGPPARSRQRPAQRARTGDPARLAGFFVLRSVADGGYANLELPRVLRRLRLNGRDAAFATELTYGALRMRGRYDPILEAAAERPLTAVDAAVCDVLRLGAHQLLGMRVPAHAATAETVGLARQQTGIGSAGFVNAVLRRVGENTLEEWLDLVAPETLDPVQRLAIRQSHPAWIVTALRSGLLGHEAATPETVEAELTALLEADNAPPRVTLVARPGLASPEELTEAAPGAATPYAPTGVVLDHGDPGRVAAVRETRAAVQDEGSQLVALALAAVPVDGRGDDEPERWADLCAGPGGKAGLLAALALQRGASVLAGDISEHRIDLVRSTLHAALEQAAPGQLTLDVADGREAGEDHPGEFDRVLLDAPCTGLGALRRRPEARWRRTPNDVPVLAQLQRQLLASALDATRAGGVVGYVTCSPHLSETRFAVADVVRRRRDVEILDAREAVAAVARQPVPDLGPGPHVQLWPHRHGTDAMFLALLRRRS